VLAKQRVGTFIGFSGKMVSFRQDASAWGDGAGLIWTVDLANGRYDTHRETLWFTDPGCNGTSIAQNVSNLIGATVFSHEGVPYGVIPQAGPTTALVQSFRDASITCKAATGSIVGLIVVRVDGPLGPFSMLPLSIEP